MKKFLKKCIQCDSEFEKSVNCSVFEWNKIRKFCSVVCANTFKKGISPSPETQFVKGQSPVPHEEDCNCFRCNPRKGSESNLWKGGQIQKECKVCQIIFYIDPYRDKTAKCCSQKCSGIYKRGKPIENSGQFKPKLSTTISGLSRKELQKSIRERKEYRYWRGEVFRRDKFTCQDCGKVGSRLNADHIKPFSYLLDFYNIFGVQEALECKELWKLSNGRTLCEDCHKFTETFGIKAKNFSEVNN